MAYRSLALSVGFLLILWGCGEDPGDPRINAGSSGSGGTGGSVGSGGTAGSGGTGGSFCRYLAMISISGPLS